MVARQEDQARLESRTALAGECVGRVLLNPPSRTERRVKANPPYADRLVLQNVVRRVALHRLPVGLRHIGTTGKLAVHPDPKSVVKCGHPVPVRGAVARRHERGMGCGGRESVGARLQLQGGLNLVSDGRRAGRPTFERTAKPCGPGASCWRQAGGGVASPTGNAMPSIRRRR